MNKHRLNGESEGVHRHSASFV